LSLHSFVDDFVADYSPGLLPDGGRRGGSPQRRRAMARAPLMSWLWPWSSRNRRPNSGQAPTLGRAEGDLAHVPPRLSEEAALGVCPAVHDAAGRFFLVSLDVARGGEQPGGPRQHYGPERRPPPRRAPGRLQSLLARKGRCKCRNHYSAKQQFSATWLWGAPPGQWGRRQGPWRALPPRARAAPLRTSGRAPLELRLRPGRSDVGAVLEEGVGGGPRLARRVRAQATQRPLRA
jgi:hypothetical protein